MWPPPVQVAPPIEVAPPVQVAPPIHAAPPVPVAHPPPPGHPEPGPTHQPQLPSPPPQTREYEDLREEVLVLRGRVAALEGEIELSQQTIAIALMKALLRHLGITSGKSLLACMSFCDIVWVVLFSWAFTNPTCNL